MRRTYHRWWSPRLGRDMELLEFGHAGKPVLVFPTSKGRFFEYEDRGMVGALGGEIAGGGLRLFCVDSIDAESWYAYDRPPSERIARHERYEDYVVEEVLPLMRQVSGWGRVGVTGCSFGGFHAVNLALRRPDLFCDCVSMGGAFDLARFFGETDAIHFHQPFRFLPGLSDPWYWEQFAGMRLLLVSGEHDICLNDNHRLASLLGAKGIPHRLDVWGDGTGHDWPWWQRMAQAYF